MRQKKKVAGVKNGTYVMERVRKREYKTQTINKTQNNNIYIYIPQTDKETLGKGVTGINQTIKRTHNS